MKMVFRWIIYAITGILALVVASILITNKAVPEGRTGPPAEALADSMLNAVNVAAWDRLRYVRWTSIGNLHYVWDKMYNLAEICFSDARVLLNLNDLEGIAWDKGVRVSGTEKQKLLDKAWNHWCNDSFWLNPVVKVRDPGVVRKAVMLENGKQGLLVTYTQGGVTPGDSYLWILDDEGLPVAWRMWVKILPTKGLKMTWEDWQKLPGGSKVALRHRVGPLQFGISNVQAGRHHSDIGLEEDPFADFH